MVNSLSAEAVRLHSTQKHSQRLHSEVTGIQKADILWSLHILRVYQNCQDESESRTKTGQCDILPGRNILA